MTILSREALLKPTARRYEVFEVPGLGTARIQNLTSGEMRKLRRSFTDKKGELIGKRAERLQDLLIAWCLVDEAGTRVLSEDDVFSPAWEEIDGAIVRTLFERCRRWTGFAADADWQAVEDAAKNSE